MSNIEAFQEYFEKVIKDLKSDQADKKIRASGQSAKSLRFAAKETKGTLFGLDTFYWQIFGRASGKHLPFDPASTVYGTKTKGKNKGKPRGDFPDLTAWMQNKSSARSAFGWSRKKDYEKLGVLFSISKKIADEGTDIFSGKREGLSFSDIIGGENLEMLSKNIGERKVTEVTTFLKNELTAK